MTETLNVQLRRIWLAFAGKWGRFVVTLLGLFIVSACSSTGIATHLPSENYNSRVSILVIHHTTANFKDSLNILTKPSSNPVSSHYLVPDPSDDTYTHTKLEVFYLVPETERAWHAGRSYWAGKNSLNDHSIGIEVVNQTYCVKPDAKQLTSASVQSEPNQLRRLCFYPDFPETQMDILIELIRGIQQRHPRISATNIVGHSDIAPQRKIDPGPRFPWQRLYNLGIGAWFDDEDVTKYWNRFSFAQPLLVDVQKALNIYGYKTETTGVLDEQTRNVLRAFQMHFRPSEVTGMPSIESVAILYALIEKYRPNKLNELISPDPKMNKDLGTVQNN